jgi:hypothetical protein
MRVRYQLDRCGLKLKLSAWQSLSLPQRFALPAMPRETPCDAEAFRILLLSLTRHLGEGMPLSVPVLDPQSWFAETASASIREKCCGCGKIFDPGHWKSLGEMERYALYKLAASSKNPGTFERAWEEFFRAPWPE